LTNVTDNEVEKAKNYLKLKLLSTLQNPSIRLEDTVKNYSILGKLPYDYI
jgi:hypothetical protein